MPLVMRAYLFVARCSPFRNLDSITAPNRQHVPCVRTTSHVKEYRTPDEPTEYRQLTTSALVFRHCRCSIVKISTSSPDVPYRALSRIELSIVFAVLGAEHLGALFCRLVTDIAAPADAAAGTGHILPFQPCRSRSRSFINGPSAPPPANLLNQSPRVSSRIRTSNRSVCLGGSPPVLILTARRASRRVVSRVLPVPCWVACFARKTRQARLRFRKAPCEKPGS